MSGSEWSLAFSGSRLLVRRDGAGAQVPTRHDLARLLGSDSLDEWIVDVRVGEAEGRRCLAVDLPEELELEDGLELVGLRALHALIPEELFRAAGTARQKVEWLRTHRFCSRCATQLERHQAEETLRCPACGQLHFPRLAPAVIVLVERPGEALLARSAHFPAGIYSTLAGFVEPGESLEECVQREMFEEVGVQVANLRYFGSQPHPFPHSLMIGFVAEWVGGEIRPDPEEIEDARWFTPDALPVLPPRMSIARALVEDFVHRHR